MDGYLKELNVVLHGGELAQLRLARLELVELFLHVLQELLGLANGPLLLGFHQLSHLKALQLNRPDQLGEDGVAVLGGRASRALERAKQGGGEKRRVWMSWSLWT